jgi:hypothetical protein
MSAADNDRNPRPALDRALKVQWLHAVGGDTTENVHIGASYTPERAPRPGADANVSRCKPSSPGVRSFGAVYFQVSVDRGSLRHGNAGTHGSDGNVVAVSYRIYRR